MIQVNIFKISNDKLKINVSIETLLEYNITSLKFWTNNTYNNGLEHVDLSYKLENINNKEVFEILTSDIPNIDIFNGIYFLEMQDNNINENNCVSCINPNVAVTASLDHVKEHLLNEVLSLSVCNEELFTDNICNGNKGLTIVNINLMMNAIITSLELGYYIEAIDIYNSLLKLYNIKVNSTCNNCDKIKDRSMNHGLGYGILNNNFILI